MRGRAILGLAGLLVLAACGTGAPPSASVVPSEVAPSGGASEASELEGVWHTGVLTPDDFVASLQAADLGEYAQGFLDFWKPGAENVFSLRISGGVWVFYRSRDGGVAEEEDSGSYTIDGNTVTIRHNRGHRHPPVVGEWRHAHHHLPLRHHGLRCSARRGDLPTGHLHVVTVDARQAMSTATFPRFLAVALGVVLALSMAGCAASPAGGDKAGAGEPPMTLTLGSPDGDSNPWRRGPQALRGAGLEPVRRSHLHQAGVERGWQRWRHRSRCHPPGPRRRARPWLGRHASMGRAGRHRVFGAAGTVPRERLQPARRGDCQRAAQQDACRARRDRADGP